MKEKMGLSSKTPQRKFRIHSFLKFINFWKVMDRRIEDAGRYRNMYKKPKQIKTTTTKISKA